MTEAEWIAFLRRPELPAFNRAMMAAPDDDLPRLVFADWLDENCPDARICAVIRASMNGKSHPIRHLPMPTDVSVSAERARLTLALERDQPPPDEHACRSLWESGWVGGVLLNSPSPAAVRVWLTHSGMASVVWLAVIQSGSEVAEIIAAAHPLTAVRYLDLSMCELGADGVRVLAEAKMPALRSLTLFNSALHEDGAAAVASAPVFALLTALDVENNQLGPAGVRALANSPHLTRLKSLRLSHNQIGNQGVRAIVSSASSPGLRSLDLDGNLIGPEGAYAVRDSDRLAGLTALQFSENRIGDSGVKALAASSHLARLQMLDLSSCFDSSAGAVALAESSHLHDLRSLNLSDNPIGDAGLIALAASPLFARLDKLSLGSCGITIAGLRVLAASQRFAEPRPLELWLTGNAFGEEVEAEVESFPPTLAATVRNAIDWGIDRR